MIDEGTLREAARGLLHVEIEPNGVAHLRWRWLSRKMLTSALAVALGVGMLGNLWRPDLPVVDLYVNPYGVILGGMVLVSGYVLLAYLLNQTRVTVDAMILVVKHGPIPWPGGGRWAIADVVRFFPKTNYYGAGGSAKAKSVDYSVNAVLRSGAEVEIVNGPLTEERADAVYATLAAWASAPRSTEAR